MTSPLSPYHSAFVSKGGGEVEGGGGRELDLSPTIPPTALLFKVSCGGGRKGEGLGEKSKSFS